MTTSSFWYKLVSTATEEDQEIISPNKKNIRKGNCTPIRLRRRDANSIQEIRHQLGSWILQRFKLAQRGPGGAEEEKHAGRQ